MKIPHGVTDFHGNGLVRFWPVEGDQPSFCLSKALTCAGLALP